MDVNQARGKAQYAHFYMGTRENSEKSLAEGRPIFDDVPFIKIYVAGDALNVIDQPVWDDPLKENSHTRRFPEEWRRFKEGLDAEAQQGGTPLGLMPGLTQGQVREMAALHVKTVEQLADMSDSHTGKYMGVLKLREEARAYIARAKGAAPEKAMRAELEARDLEIDTLKKQMAMVLADKGLTSPPALPGDAPAPRARKGKAVAA